MKTDNELNGEELLLKLKTFLLLKGGEGFGKI